jgi:hypothetical protein
MAKKYTAQRFPLEYKKILENKKAKIEMDIKKITGKNVKIPRTKILGLMINQPLYLYDRDLIGLIKKNRRQNERTFTI